MSWAERAVWLGEMRNACKILVGKLKGKRLLTLSLEENIKIYFEEI
jgi:hypothetical protein